MKSLTPLTLTLWHQSNRCYFFVMVSRCQSVIVSKWYFHGFYFAYTSIQIRSYKYHRSTFHRICIGFASNLHRLCNGGSLEDHWCVYTVSIDTFKIDILLYYTPYLWIKHKNRQPSPFAPKTLCISMFQGKRWRLTDFNSYSENPTASDVILADFVELRY